MLSGSSENWELVIPVENISPSGRSKHVSVYYSDHIYIFGGAQVMDETGKSALRDLWKFNISIIPL